MSGARACACRLRGDRRPYYSPDVAGPPRRADGVARGEGRSIGRSADARTAEPGCSSPSRCCSRHSASRGLRRCRRPTSRRRSTCRVRAQLRSTSRSSYPNRSPGTPGAEGAATVVPRQLRPYGFVIRVQRFDATDRRARPARLQEPRRREPGRSQSRSSSLPIETTPARARRDDNASGTAALIELARSYANPAASSAHRRPRGASVPRTRSSFSRPTAARSAPSAPRISRSTRSSRGDVVAVDRPRRDRRDGPAAARVRRRPAALAEPGLLETAAARSSSRDATAAAAERSPPADRPRLPVQLLRAGALHRPRASLP